MDANILNKLLDSGLYGKLNDPQDKIKEPASIILSFEHFSGKYAEEVNVEGVVNYLQEKGIKAAAYNREEGADISATLVTPTGIQSPFVSPDKIKGFAKELAYTLNDCPLVNLTGYGASKTIEQMTEPAHDCQHKQELMNEFPNLRYFSNHPDLEKAAKIFQTFGKDFDSDLLQEALSHSNTNTLKDEIFYNSEVLFRGTGTSKPYQIDNENEAFSFCYASFIKNIAINHPIPLLRREDIGNYGLVQLYEAHKSNVVTENFGLERGLILSDITKAHETSVVPHYNQFIESYLNFNNSSKHTFVKINDTPEWQGLCNLHIPAMHYNYISERLRRESQFKQALLNNGKPFVYNLDGKEDKLGKEPRENQPSILTVHTPKEPSMAKKILQMRGVHLGKKDRKAPQEKEKQITETQEKAHPQKKSAFGKLMRVLSGRISRKTKKAIRKITNSNVRPDLNRGGRS